MRLHRLLQRGPVQRVGKGGEQRSAGDAGETGRARGIGQTWVRSPCEATEPHSYHLLSPLTRANTLITCHRRSGE